MHSPATQHEPTQRAVRTLQLVTIAWMSIELSVSAWAGIRACSVALTGFAGDSAIELFSALVVLRRFAVGPSIERTAARINALLLYALAAYIALSSAASLLSTRFRPQPSLPGIALLLIAAIVMPILGRKKARLAAQARSDALQADAAQSNVCAWMSWIALAGLVLNALFHIAWADSLAALFLLPLVLHEANQARQGKICACNDTSC
ncbi:MAG: cation transporter [Acidobacteriaceae bacterium]